MKKINKLFTGALFLGTILVNAQNTVGTRQLPTSYDNQIYTPSAIANANALNTPTEEKIELSPKELIDINLNSMANDPVLRNANWGFVVFDPKTKQIISSYNENTPLIPASTTKLLTTETALHILGEKFHWHTQLEYSGEIDVDGNLNGNVYIIGSGDPSLGTGKAGAPTYRELITEFILEISNAGIKKINGNIYVQTAVFKENKMAKLPENVVWLENGNYYLPVGSTKDINPANEKLIVKKSSPFGTEKKFYYISPYINQMVFADQYDTKELTTKVSEPPLYLANSLRASLVKSGISVSGRVENKLIDTNPEKREIISTHKSPTLSEIVYETNQKSDNALAEAILRAVGFMELGDQSLESGRLVVTKHLSNTGFDMSGFSYSDGSGLSRLNNVTPISQVKFLTNIMQEKYYKTYFDSLPIGGQTGTLKKMFFGSGNGQVFAKTGTLNKVKSLAGYIKTYSGRTLVFSLLVNNYSGSVDSVKRRMEKILEPVLGL